MTIQPVLSQRAPRSPDTIDTNIGELISLFYQQFLDIYGDPDLASVAAAALINEVLAGIEDEDVIKQVA